MLRKVFSARVHAVPDTPLAAFTATLTPEEKAKVIKVAGRQGAMIVIAEGPVPEQGKICVLRRPTSQCPFRGRTLENGKFVPGLLQLLEHLILDKFIDAISGGKPYKEFHRTIIFFRSAEHMAKFNAYLQRRTGLRLGPSSSSSYLSYLKCLGCTATTDLLHSPYIFIPL